CLLHARGGDADVVVVAESLLDERFQDRILKDVPPRRVGNAGRVASRLAAEGRRLSHGGTAVVRTDRAAAQQRGGDDGNDDPSVLRGGHDRSSCPPAIGAGSALGNGTWFDGRRRESART